MCPCAPTAPGPCVAFISRFLYGICFNFFFALTGYPGKAPTALGCPIQRTTDKKGYPSRLGRRVRRRRIGPAMPNSSDADRKVIRPAERTGEKGGNVPPMSRSGPSERALPAFSVPSALPFCPFHPVHLPLQPTDSTGYPVPWPAPSPALHAPLQTRLFRPGPPNTARAARAAPRAPGGDR